LRRFGERSKEGTEQADLVINVLDGILEPLETVLQTLHTFLAKDGDTSS
jgi:hypothetical protein